VGALLTLLVLTLLHAPFAFSRRRAA
jgi:hypothetical protein